MKRNYLLMLFIAIAGPCISQNLSPELYRVNIEHVYAQNPSISMHPGGDYTIVWQDDSHDATNLNNGRDAIFGRLYSAGGAAKQNAYELPRYHDLYERGNLLPSVAMTNNNAFYVAWETIYIDNYTRDVNRRIIRQGDFDLDSYDVSQQSPYFPKDYDERFQYVEEIDFHVSEPLSSQPSVAILPYTDKKGFNEAIAWVKNTEIKNNLSNIWLKYSFNRNNGGAFSVNYNDLINITQTDDQVYYNPIVLRYGELGDMKLVVAWEKRTNNDSEIHFKRFEYSFEQNKLVAGEDILVIGSANSMHAAINQSGMLAITWAQNGTGGNKTVYTQLFNTDNQAVVAPVVVDKLDAALEKNPCVAIDKEGNSVVCWELSTNNTYRKNLDFKIAYVMARHFNNKGQKTGGKYKVAQGLVFDNDYTQEYLLPQIAMHSDGNFAIVWQENGGIYARYVDIHSAEAPVDLELNQTAIEENIAEPTIGKFISYDPNLFESFTYSLVDGEGDDDNNTFIIDGTKLKAANGITFNYELKKSYRIRVRTTEDKEDGLSFEKVLQIEVKNLNEVPTDIQMAINEDANSKVVATLSSIDEDEGQNHIFGLVNGAGDDDNALFVVAGNELKVAEGAVLNKDAEHQYKIRIATSDAPNSASWAFSERGRAQVEAAGEFFYFEKEFEVKVKTNISTSLDNNSIDDTIALSIYPNPVENTLNIKTNLPYYGPVKLQIINNQGQVIKAISLQNSGIINIQEDVSTLKTGLYFLNIQMDNGHSKTLKWLKK